MSASAMLTDIFLMFDAIIVRRKFLLANKFLRLVC